MPDKAQKQTMIIIMPARTDGLHKPAPQLDGPALEPALFTLNETPSHAKAQMAGRILSSELRDSLEEHAKEGDDVGQHYLEGRKVEAVLRQWSHNVGGDRVPLTGPTKDEFSSAIPNPLRKGEDVFHVKCYRGTKDGTKTSSRCIGKKVSLQKPCSYLHRFSEAD